MEKDVFRVTCYL